jgi:hypothetical protein
VCVAAVVNEDSRSPPLDAAISTRLARRPGGSGGTVLGLNILQVDGKPKLVLLASVLTTFKNT